MKPLLFSFLAGLASACGFQPFGLWPLTIAAFAFLLWLVERAPSLRSALARGYWFGVGQFVLGLNWIATAFTFQSNMPASLGWVAVVLLAFYIAVYPAMATGLAWRHGRGQAMVTTLILAAAWIVTEWLRATVFTGFAWNPVGVALIDTRAAQWSVLVGTYGLSGIVVLSAGLVAALLRALRARNWSGTDVPAIALVAVAFAGVPFRSALAPAPTAQPVRIVQPNIGQQDKWKEGFEARNFELLRRLSRDAAGTPRLLLWPEAAVTEPLDDTRLLKQPETGALRQEVASLLGPQDLLLTGGITVRSKDGYRTSSATNSVFAMNRAGTILGRYDKAHLVPYGEYLPMRPILSAIGLSRLAPGDIDYDPGPGPRTIDLGRFGKVGFQLCYEIIFSGEVVDPHQRPDFIFNPSNDAWFGAWGPPQHLAQARLRALEEGIPVLRSTPTGISAVIDANGRLLASLPWRTAGVIDTRLPAPRPPTLFAQYGNILPFLFAFMLAGIAIAVRRKPR